MVTPIAAGELLDTADLSHRTKCTSHAFDKPCAGARTDKIGCKPPTLDVWHHPGNVHDSNGAKKFILDCIREIRQILPNATLEVRMDSAFFSEELIEPLDILGIHYTISVPFARLAELKRKIERRTWWRKADKDTAFFELNWKPKKWDKEARFVVIRTREPQQRKGPLQLGLFEPRIPVFEGQNA